MGANMDHLSLGKFITSKVRDVIRTQDPRAQKSEDTRAEEEMLMEVACWQQVMRETDIFLVEPTNVLRKAILANPVSMEDDIQTGTV